MVEAERVELIERGLDRLASREEPANILLVDDEPKNLLALEAVLAAPDRRLMRAQSGPDALRWLLRERFAVILMDVHMPEVDGFETARLIRGHARSESTPIIFLTAANRDETFVSQGYSLGAVDYILKPFDPDILRSKVAVFVDLFRKSEQVRKQSEQLTETRAFLENILESMTDYAVIVQDLEGRILAWYEGAYQQFGYRAAEVVECSATHRLFAPEEIESGRLQAVLAAARKQGKAADTFVQLRRNGQRFTSSVSVNLSRGPDGEAAGYVLVIKDISEDLAREQRERLLLVEQAALAEAELARQRFALLADISSELGSLLDDGEALGRVATCLARELGAACLLDLLEEGEVQRVAVAGGHAGQELRALTPDPASPALGRVLAGDSLVMTLVGEEAESGDEGRRLGALGFTTALLAPIVARDRVVGIIWILGTETRSVGEAEAGFARDVGRRIGLGLDNLRLYQAAQAAIRLRDDFLQVAAHELRTPVTVLRMQAQLLLRRLQQGTVDRAQLLQSYTVLSGHSERLGQLISRLLDISQLQGGKLALDPVPTALVPLIREAVTRAEAAAEGRTFTVCAPDDLQARVDPLRVEQVLVNLFDNAIKYSPADGNIEVEATQADPETVRIAVRDRGPGVPEEHRDRIFERYHQAHTDPHRPGMGLGLFIARQIVELHGGRIQLEFPPDGGSRFVVSLPAAGPA